MVQVDEIRQKPNGDARGDAESVDDDEEVEDEEEEEGVGGGIFPLGIKDKPIIHKL